MPTLDDVGVRLSLKDDFSGPTRGAREELQRFVRQTEAADRAGRSASSSLGGFSSAVDNTGGQLGGLNTALLGTSEALGNQLGQTLQQATVGLLALGAAAVTFGIRAESGFEQSEIAFGALLGSVEAGNALFAELQAFNLQTPFELQNLTSATQLLLRFGFAGDEALETIKSISDVAALSGDRAPENLERIALALGQIATKGVIRGDELLQLNEAGLPANELLKQITGFSGPELQAALEQGLELDPQVFFDAINDPTNEALARFRGGAAAQAATLKGVFSNLKDTLNVQLAEATEPLADALTAQIPGLSTQLGAVIDTVAPPVVALLEGLLGVSGSALQGVGSVLASIATGVQLVGEAAGPAFRELGPVLPEITAGLDGLFVSLADAAPELVGVFVDLVGLLPEVLGIVSDLLPVLTTFADLLDRLLGNDDLEPLFAGLLITLLGYKALAGVTGIVTGLAGALFTLSGAQTAAGATSAGLLGRLGLTGAGAAVGGVGGVAGVGLSARDASQDGLSIGNVASGVGTGALAGAAIGSVVPVIGTGIGALAGAALGGAATVAAGTVGRRSTVPAAPPTSTTVQQDRRTILEAGAVQVTNPTADVDVQRAIEAALLARDEAADRRGGA